jgi:hypothetical protein
VLGRKKGGEGEEVQREFDLWKKDQQGLPGRRYIYLKERVYTKTSSLASDIILNRISGENHFKRDDSQARTTSG